MYTVTFILLFFTEDVKGYVDKFLGHIYFDAGVCLQY